MASANHSSVSDGMSLRLAMPSLRSSGVLRDNEQAQLRAHASPDDSGSASLLVFGPFSGCRLRLWVEGRLLIDEYMVDDDAVLERARTLRDERRSHR